MQKSDVRKLQSFLYTSTSKWPKWHELGEVVDYIKTWSPLWTTGVGFNFGGVSGFLATKSTGTWHFTVSRHSPFFSVANARELYENGETHLRDGQIIKTDQVYAHTFIPFSTFCTIVSDLVRKHSPRPHDVLMIKDVGAIA